MLVDNHATGQETTLNRAAKKAISMTSPDSDVRIMEESRIPIEMLPQPDEMTCGPTCLHAVYRYFGEQLVLDEVINEISSLETGGTLAVFLACHALRRGYQATIFTYNLQVFDPSWFDGNGVDLAERLRQQMDFKQSELKLQIASRGYLDFLQLGGRLRFVDLSRRLIRSLIRRKVPILTGLSATYLYRTPREFGPEDDYDDVRGEPSGHFVVLNGYNRVRRTVLVSDPQTPNPYSNTHEYAIDIDRVICAVLLGILTYDANLLVIMPRTKRPPS
jgi:hypothetical protein